MNHALPPWIERLLGLEAVTGRATAWRLEWTWPWPSWATLLFLAFAAGFVAAMYGRENRRASRAYRTVLAAMRLGLIVLAMLMAAQVSLRPQRSEPPELAIIVDDSLSMTLRDERLDRWSLLQTLFSENDDNFLRRLAERYSPRVELLSDGRTIQGGNVSEATAAIRDMKPGGEQSRLGTAVSAAIDRRPDAPPAAVLVLSDGVNTEGPSLVEAAELARGRGVPLWFVGFGGERQPRELRLSDLTAEESVFLGDALMVQFRLEARGLEGKKVAVAVRRRDADAHLAESEIIAEADGRSRLICLPFRPAEPERIEYVIEATADGIKSNRLSSEVKVSREKLSVLMVQAAPSFEFRYLHNLLVRRDDIELRGVLQEADPGHAAQAAGFLAAMPSTRDELFAFDVIILGDANPALLASDTLKNLAEFVERPEKGGGVAIICGPRFMPAAYAQTPLAGLLPLVPRGSRTAEVQNNEQGFHVRPTELGLASPGMQLADTAAATRRAWDSLPPLYWRWNITAEQLKPAAGLLAVAAAERDSGDDSAPLICGQYVGAGRVLFHATDETWRWRWRLGDEYFARYWMQMIHWLGRAKLAAASATIGADLTSYRAGEPVRLLVRFRDERLAPAEDDAAAMVEPSGGKPLRVRLRRVSAGRGLFEGVADDLPPGEYRVWLVSPRLPDARPSATFAVLPPVGELARREADFAAMQAAAELSGGRLVGLDDAGRLADELPPGRPAVVERLPPRPLWNRWPLVAAFLGILIGEWTLRKRRGMA